MSRTTASASASGAPPLEGIGLPVGRVVLALPLGRVRALVRHSEVPAREPPPEDATEPCALAPAIWVAATRPLAWVVEPAQHRCCHIGHGTPGSATTQ